MKTPLGLPKKTASQTIADKLALEEQKFFRQTSNPGERSVTDADMARDRKLREVTVPPKLRSSKTAAPYEMGDPREKYVQEGEMERRDRARGDEAAAMSDYRQEFMQRADFRGAAVKVQQIMEALATLDDEGIEPFMGLNPGEDWQPWYAALEQALLALQNMERAK
jgi:hypothetical protein